MIHRRPKAAGLAVILCSLGVLPGTRLASAESDRAPAAGERVRAELQRLNETVAALVRLVEAWAADAGGAERMIRLGELDRSIAFLDRELRGLRDERDVLEAEIAEVDESTAAIRRHGGSSPGDPDTPLSEVLSKLAVGLGGDLDEQLAALERRRLSLYERGKRLDSRIDEVRATLETRRAWRAKLSAGIARRLDTGSR